MPLLTKAMRESRRLQEMYKYEKVSWKMIKKH